MPGPAAGTPAAEALDDQVAVLGLGVGVSVVGACLPSLQVESASGPGRIAVAAGRVCRPLWPCAAGWAWEVARELTQAWRSLLAVAHRCP